MGPLPFSVPGDSDLAHAAMLYRADGATRRGVLAVLAHGAGAGQSHPFMVRVARALAARGIDVVTFDFPYMQKGRSGPDRAPVLESTFRSVVVGASARPELAGARLFIGGKSMGGRIATHLAATLELWPLGAAPLAGVIVFGYPLNPPGGPSKRSPDRTSHFATITVPTLIVQGTRDSFGGPDQIRTAIPAAHVLDVPTGDHSLAVLKSSGRTQDHMDAEVIEAIVAFTESCGRAIG